MTDEEEKRVMAAKAAILRRRVTGQLGELLLQGHELAAEIEARRGPLAQTQRERGAARKRPPGCVPLSQVQRDRAKNRRAEEAARKASVAEPPAE